MNSTEKLTSPNVNSMKVRLLKNKDGVLQPVISDWGSPSGHIRRLSTEVQAMNLNYVYVVLFPTRIRTILDRCTII